MFRCSRSVISDQQRPLGVILLTHLSYTWLKRFLPLQIVNTLLSLQVFNLNVYFRKASCTDSQRCWLFALNSVMEFLLATFPWLNAFYSLLSWGVRPWSQVLVVQKVQLLHQWQPLVAIFNSFELYLAKVLFTATNYSGGAKKLPSTQKSGLAKFSSEFKILGDTHQRYQTYGISCFLPIDYSN